MDVVAEKKFMLPFASPAAMSRSVPKPRVGANPNPGRDAVTTPRKVAAIAADTKGSFEIRVRTKPRGTAVSKVNPNSPT